jgi:hypothetical protein
MTLSADDLYALLPAMQRTADEANGGALRGLIGVLAEQVGVLDADMRRFYADQFIETCAPWVVPYIGDLIGWSGLAEGVPGAATSRTDVANTLGYRRRKGTVIALEQIARDVTGRSARVVEYFRLLAVTQSLHHVRPGQGGFVDLRDGDALERLGTAFDRLDRTVGVRRIAPSAGGGQTLGTTTGDTTTGDTTAGDPTPLEATLHGDGRFNIPELGVHVWRWIPNAVTAQPAFAVDARRFMFSPLGANLPLFNAVPTRASFSALATRTDVPQPISRREFVEAPGDFYGNLPAQAADGTLLPKSLAVYDGGNLVALARVAVCNLADVAGGWAPGPAGMVAIDPVLGRIAFPANQAAPGAVTVDYVYGAAMAIGGGPYERAGALPTSHDWQVTVGSGGTASLAAAVAAFNAAPVKRSGLILVPGFGAYPAALTGGAGISIAAGSTLAIVAVQAGTATPQTIDAFPTLQGDIAITGLAGPANASPAQVTFSGVRIAGTVSVSGQPVTLTLEDCTLAPGRGLTRVAQPLQPGAASISVGNAGSLVVLDRCISGPLRVHAEASARLNAAIVDAAGDVGVAYAGPDGAGEGGALQAEQATIVGKVRTQLLSLASNTIFFARLAPADPWPAALWCTRQQSGCVRFCVLPDAAQVPRTYRCLQGPALRPHFISLSYGHPSYGMLAGSCPVAVWRGADDDSQIGALHDLFETQGIANLRARLTEYAPFSLEAGVFLVPSLAEPVTISTLPYAPLPTLADFDALAAPAIGMSLL